MTDFVKVVDQNGSKIYINSAYIISVRPEDHQSFVASGAVITFQLGSEVANRVIDVGETTHHVLDDLGIPR